MEINITTIIEELQAELSELNVKIPEIRNEKLEICKKYVKKKTRKEEVIFLIKEYQKKLEAQ
jgi:hypothetical protein